MSSSDSSTTTGHRRRPPVHVEIVSLKEYKKAAKTLQMAFKEDLYVHYLVNGIDDPKLQAQVDLALYEGSIYSTIISGGIVLAVRDVEGEKEDPDCPFLAVACFEPPLKKKEKKPRSLFANLWSMYHEGYLKFVWLANKETRQRVLEEQTPMLEKFREDVLGDQALQTWYLADIGAIEKGRGKGLSRAIVDYACRTFVDRYTGDDELDAEMMAEIKAAAGGGSSGHVNGVNGNGNGGNGGNGNGNGRAGNGGGVGAFFGFGGGASSSQASSSMFQSNSQTTQSRSSHSHSHVRHPSDLFTDQQESQLDSEISSYKFGFDLDSDNLTDYSGYSSVDSDSSSAHSSWYYNEEDDVLAQYDNRERQKGAGAPLYLESSHPRNRKIYQKLGFTYIKTVPVAQVTDPKGKQRELTLDLMVRGPRGARWNGTLAP